MLLVHVLLEALESLWRESRRMAPMAAGIVWGVSSVFLLGAIANGFERTQRQVIEAFGDQFMLLRFNKPTPTRSDPKATRQILVDEIDLQRIRANASAIEYVSPKAFVWRSRVTKDGEAMWMTPVGVDPEYARICNVPIEEGGRWLSQSDIEQELPVVVIGAQARKELFGDGPYLGEKIKLTLQDWFDHRGRGRRGAGGSDAFVVEEEKPKPYTRDLTVIGALKDVELSDEFYVSNKRVGFVPYPLFERISEQGAGFLVVRPRTPGEKEQALGEVRAALAERYHFDPDDRNTVLPYFDSIERSEKIDRVFGGIKLFLGAVGMLILLLGAVGVANVVLMSVAARTFEFGLRRALGCRRRYIFLQVFLEAGLVCALSGVFGFLMGLAAVQAVALLPLPQGFARPIADLSAATIPGILLLGVTLCAALWPAWRAVRSDPVGALRGSAL